jgi:hypothetical protein
MAKTLFTLVMNEKKFTRPPLFPSSWGSEAA